MRLRIAIRHLQRWNLPLWFSRPRSLDFALNSLSASGSLPQWNCFLPMACTWSHDRARLPSAFSTIIRSFPRSSKRRRSRLALPTASRRDTLVLVCLSASWSLSRASRPSCGKQLQYHFLEGDPIASDDDSKQRHRNNLFASARPSSQTYYTCIPP
jgi:hypothetical protein